MNSTTKKRKKVKHQVMHEKFKANPSRKRNLIKIPITDFSERIAWMNELTVLREKATFCDAQIRCSDGKLLKVDRNVLSACSAYFKALYQNTVTNPRNQPVEVFLPDIASDVMVTLIEFAYTGQLSDITVENFERIVQAVDRLQILGALELCHQHLIDSINLNNCISSYQISRIFYAPRVIEQSKKFILHNFSIVWKGSRDFYILTADEIGDLIRDDQLNVRREETTYEALVSWTAFDSEHRAGSFAKLLRLVRFGNSAIKFLESTVAENALVRADLELSAYIRRVNSVLSDIYLEPLPSKFNIYLHPFLRPRIPRDIVFVYGGWSTASATNIIETYDCRVNKWYMAENLSGNKPRAYHGMVSLNGLVYIIGGFDGKQHFNTVNTFDPVTKIWSERACMHTARCYVSVAVLNEKIYAMGGFDGILRTKTCERYDITLNQWTLTSSMNEQRSDACATTLDDKIFIAGGFNGSEVLSSGEYYDTESEQWTLIAPMNRPRSGVQLVAFEQSIYALGGNDGVSRQTSVEKYDVKANEWRIISDMGNARSNFASVVLEGFIYVIGGFNGLTTIQSVECYDPHTNSWQDMWNMNLHRSALSACIVSGLVNGKEYTWLRREIRKGNNYCGTIEDGRAPAADSGSVAIMASNGRSTYSEAGMEQNREQVAFSENISGQTSLRSFLS